MHAPTTDLDGFTTTKRRLLYSHAIDYSTGRFNDLETYERRRPCQRYLVQNGELSSGFINERSRSGGGGLLGVALSGVLAESEGRGVSFRGSRTALIAFCCLGVLTMLTQYVAMRRIRPML